jgi:NADH:ubiquinone oxidoreductase subunit E
MDEINELLQAFGREGYVSPEDLQTVAQVVMLLVAKVESLEQQVALLENK